MNALNLGRARAEAGPPAALLRTPLLADGGFRVYAGLPDARTIQALRTEARTRYPASAHQENWDDDLADGRGGKPRRCLLTAEAGPVQDAVYRSEWLPAWLHRECGVPVRGSGNRGSYSYYVRAGDFLDLHLDVDTCDLTLITVLEDNTCATDASGALVLYPARIGEPLRAVRERPDDGACMVKLAAGHTLAILGGMVPHRLLPVAAGQVRIISVLCFEVLV